MHAKTLYTNLKEANKARLEYVKAKRKKKKGLEAKQKYILQILIKILFQR